MNTDQSMFSEPVTGIGMGALEHKASPDPITDPHTILAQEKLDQLNNELMSLTENIPGGVKRVLNDPFFTITYISPGFLDMFGYTREEIRILFQDQFLWMVYEPDRQPLQKDLSRQLTLGNMVNTTYRAKCKDGSLIWVLNNGRYVHSETGFGSLHCVMIDVTESRNYQEALRISEERYRIISEQSDDIIFEYEVATKKTSCSSNFIKKFGYQPITFMSDQIADDLSNIHPHDQENAAIFFSSLKDYNEYSEIEFRLRKSDSSYLWCKLQVSTIHSSGGIPIRLVGKISDIDGPKREMEQLLRKSQCDSLTMLYNKNTTRNLVMDCLRESKPGQSHAMFIVDIDNFKMVNDNLGHLFGDAVLSEIASKIHRAFRETDIIGRIGGDEFLVFLKDISNQELVTKRADEIAAIFRKTFTGKNGDYKISGSIGISCFPKDGTSYTELFRTADAALYCAKRLGKDQFTLYTPSIDASHFLSKASSVLSGERIENSQKNFGENIIEYIFKILYTTSDIYSAINQILSLVGQHFSVSRAYVFENSDDNLTCSNTFEWCKEGILPQISHLQNVSYSGLGDYQSLFADDGVFFTNDISTLHPDVYNILAPQGIQAIMQVAIMDDGKFKGYVGFDDCEGTMYPTPNAIDMLNLIAKILSTFLLKKHAQDKLERSFEQIQTIINHLNCWAYIIDPSTYQLLFLNQATQKIAPSAELGGLCYESFHGLSAPCSACPMGELLMTGEDCTLEIHNEHLNVWTEATASKFKWSDGREVCMVCSYDITKYKT